MAKADSMLSILWLLQSRKRMTAAEISEILESSVRTVYRYIDSLCASGVPIIAESGHEGGFRLLKDFLEAPLFFDEDERKALFHASLFAKQANYPYTDASERALRKIEHHLNKQQVEKLQNHIKGFEVITQTRHPITEDLLQQLEQAVAESHTVIIRYQKRKYEQAIDRKLDPYALIYWNHKWYVIGYCYLRKGVRNFRVDRIESLQTTEQQFVRPEDFAAEDFFMQRIAPQPDDQEKIIVTVVGKPQKLDYLCEGYLGRYLLQRTLEKAQFVIGRDMITQFSRILLSYGDELKVIDAPEMQDEIVTYAQKIIQQYHAKPLS